MAVLRARTSYWPKYSDATFHGSYIGRHIGINPAKRQVDPADLRVPHARTGATTRAPHTSPIECYNRWPRDLIIGSRAQRSFLVFHELPLGQGIEATTVSASARPVGPVAGWIDEYLRFGPPERGHPCFRCD